MSLRAKIIGMKVGESLTVPVSEYGYTTFRSYVSELGFAYQRKYSATKNREKRTYTVIREK